MEKNQCEKCPFYDESYDKMMQSGDDIIFLSKQLTDKHYCTMFSKGIPNEVFTDKKNCKYIINSK